MYLGLYFAEEDWLKELAREAGAHFHEKLGCPVVANNPANFRKVTDLFRQKGYVDFSAVFDRGAAK